MPAPKPRFTQRLSPEQYAAVMDILKVIRAAAPEAEETAYGMPRVFSLHGRTLVGVGGSRTPSTFYILSNTVMRTFAEELDAAGIRYSKGSISFRPSSPPPADLVTRIVKARAAQNLALKDAEKAK